MDKHIIFACLTLGASQIVVVVHAGLGAIINPLPHFGMLWNPRFSLLEECETFTKSPDFLLGKFLLGFQPKLVGTGETEKTLRKIVFTL